MATVTFAQYKAERAILGPHNSAAHALHSAKTRQAFYAASQAGLVRIRAKADGDYSSVLDFDCDVSSCDWQHGKPCKYHKAEAERADSQGVYGLIGEYCATGDECEAATHGDDDAWRGGCSCEWVEAYACWGFIGGDWKGSGYDIDAMSASLSALSTARLAMVA